MIIKFVTSILMLCPIFCFGFAQSNTDVTGELIKENPVLQPLQHVSHYRNFTNNQCLSWHMKQLMAPYLLPQNHPTKRVLDKIFAKPGVIKNTTTLRKAGFTIFRSQKKSYIRVLKHQRLRGYLLKVYPDTEQRIPKGYPGWKRLTMRCVVAKKIKRIIKDQHIRNFVVADKWIYPLPPPKNRHYHQQPVVLIVKDMNIYNGERSRVAWKKKATHRTMRELHRIFSRGLGSPYLAGNLPYTKRGRFAFIDTEFGRRKLPLTRMGRHFSPSLKRYWNSLVRHGSKRYVKKDPLLADFDSFAN